MTYFVQAHQKRDGRTLWLFSRGPRTYTFTNDLPPIDQGMPTRRWHDLRGEWVYYSAARNTRTFAPPAEVNPLAPVAPDGYPGEIPVTDFEVAVFDNRFPALRAPDPNADLSSGVRLPAAGHCEVVVYSTVDHGSLADFSDAHVALLLDAWGHRVDYLLARPETAYVMPFENRGAEIGVTLPHPHGQIYAFDQVPPQIERQARNQAQTQSIERQSDLQTHCIEDHGHARAFVPTYARYPYETWIVSAHAGPSPSAWGAARLDMARALKAALARSMPCSLNPCRWSCGLPRRPRGSSKRGPAISKSTPCCAARNA